jgi:tetratricopeptide (TPR) repeat protein
MHSIQKHPLRLRSAGAALGLLLAFILHGCKSLSPEERDLAARADEAYASADWHRVRDLYSRLLETQPAMGVPRLRRGQALFHLGELDPALEDLELAAAGDGLGTEEHHAAHSFRGRCLIEKGRTLLDDMQFRKRKASDGTPRQVRDLFLAASAALHSALKLDPSCYECLLWRGYSLYRLENHHKALELFQACEKRLPRNWDHRFYRALAWEGIHGLNKESLETCLEIAAAGPRPELLPVYVYLAGVHAEVPPQLAERIPRLVEAFRRATGSREPRIIAFLELQEKERERERREIILRQTTEEARRLAQLESCREALLLLADLEKREGADPEAGALREEIIDRWVRLLEVRADGVVGAGDSGRLKELLDEFQLARSQSRKLEVKIVLQRKINDLQLVLTQLGTSQRILQIAELLYAGKYQETLNELRGLRVDDLAAKDRDLFHYLQGVASYHLGHWSAAATAFQLISPATYLSYENLDAYRGLALVKNGDGDGGVAHLLRLPPEARSDEVHRILGAHFAEKGAPQLAAAHLGAIKEPKSADLELLVQSQTRIGLAHLQAGEHARAIQVLEAARQVLDTRLRRRGVEVYAALGNAYFRLENLERAKRVYEELVHSDLTADERLRCREVLAQLSRIYLLERRGDLAYQALREHQRLGGALPPDLQNEHGRLTATYGDFLPVERVAYWSYTSRSSRIYSYTLYVTGSRAGEHRIERREGDHASEEIWSRDGLFLVKKIGPALFKLPINLSPLDPSLPLVEYRSGEQQFISEIVAFDQTVTLPEDRQFTGCLKVRLRRQSGASAAGEQWTTHIFYFAPDVGEVKQEIYRGSELVSEIVLSSVVYR